MIQKIRSSIGLKTFLSISILLIVCCALIYGLILYFMPKTYKVELESQFNISVQELIEKLEKGGVKDNSQMLKDFSAKYNASILVTDKNGAEVFSINSTAKKTEAGKAITVTSAFQYGTRSYIISATAPFEEVARSYDVLLRLLPLIAAIIIVISILGAYACSHVFSKPLIAISAAAQKMARLDMTWKCDVSGTDEIGVLAGSLNEMAVRLSDALNSLRVANVQLQRDIEQERLQEKQRIDFFTAVSHELKTPITIMKGNLEGMVYQVGVYQDRETYLRHSLKTVNDMEKLVKEILTAAKMGGSDFRLTAVSLNIGDLVRKCCRELQGVAEDKEIALCMDIQTDFYYEGDERLLKKAFSNIIGNAIAYSPAKAKVTVTLNHGVLSVENTEAHLDSDDLAHLFIPFFRVDKSRNRNMGGSGLGLYIVKTIFDHHGISYRINNTDQGVEFTVQFP